MSADTSVEAAGPNLNLSQEEKRVYGQLFRQADTDNVGVVTGEIAVKFFEKTRLDSRVLGEIWQIADQENRGFLTPAGFGIVLRLIGHAQAGREPTQEIALQQGPIPRFDGFNPTGPSVPVIPQPAQPLQAQGTGGAPLRIPPLTPEKVSQYAGLFERQNLQGGNMLPGDQAKSIFEKSGLPTEVLGRIWQLADTEQRGALVLTEFAIAMHLLTSLKTGQLRGLPNVLPAALYEAATRRGSAAAPRQSPTTTGPPLSAIPRQLSGSAHMRQASPLGRSPLNPQAAGGLAPQTTGSDWAVSPTEKTRFDQFYNDLDKTNKGFITGEEAVPFLSQSSLSEDALAQIWDLADINSEGRLTRDTFAVAMYLIRQQRSKRDGSALPTSIPPNLIPPSMRQARPPPAAVASPFDAPEPPRPPPPPATKSALDDLFGLDAPAPASLQAPMSTGGSAAKDPFANASPMQPASPVRASPTGPQFKPFVPSSSFGRTLQTHDTGGSSGSATASKPAGAGPAPMSSAMDDLLGDNDPEISKKLTNETAELANLSNQIGSLSNQMQQVQGQRTVTQKDINQTSQQKKNFEDRLTQLRTLYEKEAKGVAELKDQLQKSRDDTRKLMGEMATLDGTYRDLQVQYQQVSTALQADQQENAGLKQKISAVNAEITQLKPQIEKLKSDARQHKGLVAINKKQLSTVEGERDKLKTEAEDLTRSNEELVRQVHPGSPVATPTQVASPAPSTASANNPFFKRSGSTDMMGAFTSPPVKPYGDKSFDDIFGGFASGSTSNTPPPLTSFKQQNTGTSTASVGSFATPATSTPTASPPLSRVGEGSTPAPTHTANPLEPTATGTSIASAVDTAKSPVAAPEEDKPVDTSNGTVPGAFPEETPGVSEVTSPFAGNRDSDLFENMKRDPVNAKNDFDSAFASFGSSSKPQEKSKETNNVFSTFNTEFPPISELERDDDSDSVSEGNGFDDDFAPASPLGRKKADGKDTPKAPSSPVTTTKAAAVPNVAATEGATSATQPSNDLSSFPRSPTAKSPTAASQPKAEDPFAPASDFAPSAHTVTNTAPPAPKGAFDDLDDEFDGLEDAKEGSADDEFASISRSNLDDFNPVFDSSPPPSQPKSESPHVSNAFGVDSSYDFGTVSSTSAGAPSQPADNATPTTAPATGAAGGQGPNAPENHDWDALFASLDEPATTAKTDEQPKSPVQSQESGRPSIGSAGRALTVDGEHDDPILKNLTGMGYTRTDALNALEKYDYNLERAANFLASHS
ncbi:UBA/TS-N domain-containing protein [Xylariales sp. AK1849]|nr:UBA/TS-N domain-containing protein [Xylariales sp. AK1849]